MHSLSKIRNMFRKTNSTFQCYLEQNIIFGEKNLILVWETQIWTHNKETKRLKLNFKYMKTLTLFTLIIILLKKY